MKLKPLEFQLLRRFESELLPALGRPKNLSLVVQVSGGKDSMGLLNALYNILSSPLRKSIEPVQLVVQHFNHKTRAGESDLDAAFVKSQCALRQLKYFEEIWSQDVSENFQETARHWRRDQGKLLLEKLTAEFDCPAVLVTAHHASDHVESVLLNILRGTGLAGLRGVAAFEPTIPLWRPWLQHTQFEILEYVLESDVPYREDSTNLRTDYSRNFLRHNVIPKLRDITPALERVFLRLSENSSEALDRLYELESGLAKHDLAKDEIVLEIDEKTTPGSLLRNIRATSLELSRVLTFHAAKNIMHEIRLVAEADRRIENERNSQKLPTVKKIPLARNWSVCLSANKLVFCRSALDNQ